jgi:predicted NAD/FAD-binding protein
MKIAIVGTGIAGLSAAWLLHKHHDVTLYERHQTIGGHASTSTVAGHPPIDLGVTMYNKKTYPNLARLIEHLGIQTVETEYSFGASLHDGHIEYSEKNLFARFKNRLNARFLMMVKDMKTFNDKADKFIASKKPNMPLGLFFKKEGYSKGFAQDYLMAIGRGVWHLPPSELKKFPAKPFLRLLKMNGFIGSERPQWRTFVEGTQHYINALSAPFADKISADNGAVSIYRRANGVEITDKRGNMNTYDIVILACHPDQSLRLLQDASPGEEEMLNCFPFVQNRSYLHTDKTFMPKSKSVWSAWNFISKSTQGPHHMTFWMNKIQPWLKNEKTNYFLTVNSAEAPQGIIQQVPWFHGVYSGDTMKGWKLLSPIQGMNRTWFCGGWCGYGLHEDALAAGLAVAEAIGPERRPWDVKEVSPATNTVQPAHTL